MHIITAKLKELLSDSPSRDAVLILIHTLEEQRDELIREVQRMAEEVHPSISVAHYTELAQRNARLETALIGIYAILNIESDPAEQLLKIGQIVDEVTLYKPPSL
jgi:hypothetical protein